MTGIYYRNRILLAIGAIIAAAVFSWTGARSDIPAYRGFDISLMAQPSRIATVMIVAVALCACVAVCSLVAGPVRADAGLFCTALGLMALSIRGGPMRYTLFDARGSIFTSLAIELVLLFAIFGVGWLIVGMLSSMHLTRGERDADFVPDSETFDQKIYTTLIQAVATATLVLILCRTDQKVQCLASVGVASMLGSMLAAITAPARPSIWFWTGPLLVGLLGYVWAAFGGLGDAPIGQVTGYLSALARPLPLDYASAGIAGSMLGYWFGRSWATSEEAADAAPQDSGATIN